MRRLLGKTTLGLRNALERLRDKLWSMCIGGAFAEFGKRSVLSLPCRLAGAHCISIGSRVFLGSGSWLQALPREGRPAPRLVIGDGTCVSGTCVLSAAHEVVLEDNVLLARNVYISDHIHAYADTSRPILAQGLDKVDPVRVRAGAWLGQNVVVCPGVTIGRGAVIGANSVVTKDIPDWSVAVGAPARVVKTFATKPQEQVHDAAALVGTP